MAVTVSSYIESLMNPSGRFLTLRAVRPLLDAAGLPQFVVWGGHAHFRVMIGNGLFSIRCPLHEAHTLDVWQLERIINIRNKNNPFTAHCRHLRNELIVFDTGALPQRCDITVCSIPEGLTLTQFIHSNLYLQERKPFRSLLKNIADMASSFLDDGIIHGGLKPGNIIVSSSGKPTAVEYACEDNPQAESDTVMFALTAMNIYLIGCAPDLYRLMGEKEMFNKAHMAKYLKYINAQAEFCAIKPLINIVSLISESCCRGSSCDRPAVNEAIAALAVEPFKDLVLLADMILSEFPTTDVTETVKGTIIRIEPHTVGDPTLKVDFRTCSFVANIEDNMIRYCDRNLWGFADRHGNDALEAIYNYAEDFYEGRAKVGMGEGFGFIDRDGNFVMEPVYDILEWCGYNNIVIACREGIWAVYDREGRQITFENYDWISTPDENALIGRKGDKFGYILTDGSRLTDIRFDEAYGFRDGKALVTVGDENYYIDRQGHKMKDIK